MDINFLRPLSTPSELICQVCNKLYKNAVIFPRCACTTCESCGLKYLENSLNQNCPICKSEKNQVLVPSSFLRQKVTSFIEIVNSFQFTNSPATFMKSFDNQSNESLNQSNLSVTGIRETGKVRRYVEKCEQFYKESMILPNKKEIYRKKQYHNGSLESFMGDDSIISNVLTPPSEDDDFYSSSKKRIKYYSSGKYYPRTSTPKGSPGSISPKEWRTTNKYRSRSPTMKRSSNRFRDSSTIRTKRSRPNFYQR